MINITLSLIFVCKNVIIYLDFYQKGHPFRLGFLSNKAIKSSLFWRRSEHTDRNVEL